MWRVPFCASAAPLPPPPQAPDPSTPQPLPHAASASHPRNSKARALGSRPPLHRCRQTRSLGRLWGRPSGRVREAAMQRRLRQRWTGTRRTALACSASGNDTTLRFTLPPTPPVCNTLRHCAIPLRHCAIPLRHCAGPVSDNRQRKGRRAIKSTPDVAQRHFITGL